MESSEKIPRARLPAIQRHITGSSGSVPGTTMYRRPQIPGYREESPQDRMKTATQADPVDERRARRIHTGGAHVHFPPVVRWEQRKRARKRLFRNDLPNDESMSAHQEQKSGDPDPWSQRLRPSGHAVIGVPQSTMTATPRGGLPLQSSSSRSCTRSRRLPSPCCARRCPGSRPR
jgi:hypothetical protein